MHDRFYDSVPYQLSELRHRYGPRVHLLANPLLLSQLARACSPEVAQPELGRLVASLYRDLAQAVLCAEFPRERAKVPSRMARSNPAGIFEGEVLKRQTRAVAVDIARAGTVPSQVVYELLNEALEPQGVRQDHLLMGRTLNGSHQVTGSSVLASKIGGSIEGAMVLFPDPMGATGSSLSTALSLYKTQVKGPPAKLIGMHLIVTPEYLRKMEQEHPDVSVYALRLDRGLSPPEVWGTVPGEKWELERGLDDNQYIVPGGGGLGELLNNADA